MARYVISRKIAIDFPVNKYRLAGVSDDWQALEDEAARKISEAMTLLNQKRWSKATPAERKKQGKLLAAGRRKARRVKK